MSDDVSGASGALEVRGFQLDAGQVGNIANSVNLFRGDVTLPLSLVSLQGRNGLDVQVAAIYSSHVQDEVATTNRDAPTGVLGLGWSLPFEQILVQKDCASPFGATYSLVSQGATNPLLFVDEVPTDSGTAARYTALSYEFWQILYFADIERWEITKEDGVKYVYGDNRLTNGAIQYGVAFGNWIGSSSQGNGEPFALAWNLSSVVHYLGDTISFEYDADLQPIGPGQTYTRASYLSKITDVYGRIVQLNYLPKTADEVDPPHVVASGNNAFQDRYETLYLASIDVQTATGVLLFSLYCDYTLINLDPQQRPTYCKRCLIGTAQISGAGKALAGPRFSYVTDSSQPNAGALQTVTYPEGGTATYVYAAQPIGTGATAADLIIASPEANCVPRVWFGSDYVVVTWYSEASSLLYVTVYTWCGAWFPSSSSGQTPASISGTTLNVAAGQDIFAVSFTDTAGNFNLNLFSRVPYQRGEWPSWSPGPLPTSTGFPTPVVVGAQFVVVGLSDAASNSATIYQYSFNPNQPGQWLASSTQTQQCTALGAGSNFYAVFGYDPVGNTGSSSLYYLDDTLNWNGPLALDDYSKLYVNSTNQQPVFSWSMGSCFAVASYVSSVSGTTVTNQVTIYNWDAAFSTVTPTVLPPYSPPSQIAAQVWSVAAGGLVGSLQNLARFDGETWQQMLLTVPANASDLSFGYGNDLAVLTGNDGSLVGQQFDPVQLTWNTVDLGAGGSTATAPPPAITGTFLVVGTQIFTQNPDTSWSASPVTLPTATNAASIYNRAPSFIAFETGTGSDAQAMLIGITDGTPGQPVAVTSGRLHVDDTTDPGTMLVGLNAYVSYPVDAPSFDQAQTLTLSYVIADQLAASQSPGQQLDYPVVALTIDDGYQQTSTAYAYDPTAAITDPSGQITQYPLVRVYPGLSAAPPGDDVQAPFGFTEYYFFNGLSPALADIFAPASYGQYYSMLSGQIVWTRAYNSQSRLVAATYNNWSITPVDASVPPGIYTRVTQSTSSSDVRDLFSMPPSNDLMSFLAGEAGVPTDLAQQLQAAGLPPSGNMVSTPDAGGDRWLLVDSDNQTIIHAEIVSESPVTVGFSAGTCATVATAYDDASGLPVAKTTYNRSIDNVLETLVSQTTYAHQVPAYSGMADNHILTPVAQTTATTGGKVVSNSVTTYVEDGGSGTGRWTASAAYAATTPDANYDFTSGGPQPNWLTRQTVVSRIQNGAVQENVDQLQRCVSVIYDTQQNYPVASFFNGSLSHGEVAYFGAEAYETNPGWALQPGGNQPSLNPDDSHTGTRCIVLSPAPTTSLQYATTLQPTNGNAIYLFSCWYKTAPGFDNDPGSAQWQLNASAGGQTVAPPAIAVAGTQGEWTYFCTTIDISALAAGSAGIELTIAITNGKTSASLLLDELRLSPAVGRYGARVYDADTFLPSARTADNGITSRYVRDSFQNVVALVGLQEVPVRYNVAYQSRAANGNVFNAADPNAHFAVSGSTGGAYQRYADGSAEWMNFWSAHAPNPQANWQVVDGELRHVGDGPDVLTLQGSSGATDTALQLRVTPLAAPSQALGIRIGSIASVRWVPAAGAAGQWQLYDEQAQKPLASTTPGPRFSISSDYVTALNNEDVATISQALAGQGILLSAQHVSIAAPSAGNWTIADPDNLQTYAIATTATGLSVSQLSLDAKVWTLVLHNNAILFHADGQLLFAHQFTEAVSGAVALFTADPVGYGDIAVLTGIGVSAGYGNGSGQIVQAQALEDAAATAGNNCITKAVVYDALGRAAVKTKPMRYENALFGYQPGFAQFDWTTGMMSGDVARYYSAGGGGFSQDGGYPYLRALYEDSPLGRLIARGNPGADFAIIDADNPANSHVDGYQFASNGSTDAFADLNLYANEFSVDTVTDANGIATHVLRDRFGQRLLRRTADASQPTGFTAKGYDYDALGRLIAIKPGRYYETSDSAWIITRTFGMLGQTIQSSNPDQGAPTQFIYNAAGVCRFVLPPSGATATPPYFYYQKVDALGRAVEMGTVNGQWNVQTLTGLAEDPNWPSDGVWSRKFVWDGDPTKGGDIGRLTQTLTSNQGTGTPDVTETVQFDQRGNVGQTRIVFGDDETAYVTQYQYDMRGQILKVTYPTAENEPSTAEVVYTLNNIGQTVRIDTSWPSGSFGIAYTYNAVGKVDGETCTTSSGPSLTRSVTYCPPGWPTEISDDYLTQKLQYLPASSDTPGYYDGQLASATYDFNWSGSPAGYGDTFAYDATGNLLSVANDSLAAGSETLSYDSNGNVLQVVTASGSEEYTYAPGTNQVINTSGGAQAALAYDSNGEILSASTGIRPIELSAIAYDRSTGLATGTTVGGGSGSSACNLAFQYDAKGQRVQKTSTVGSDSTSWLYLRGGGDQTFVRRRRQGASDELQLYIYGLDGLKAFVSGGKTYVLSNDHIGSTRVVVDASGNQASVAASYDYTPFGAPLRVTGTDGLLDVLFQGQERDQETGLYVTARIYDPYLRRFYAGDPLIQYSTPYAFAGNNPIGYSDPTGLWSFGSLFDDIAGFLTSAFEIAAGALVTGLSGGAAESVGGALIGAGVSGAMYTGTHLNDFSWAGFGAQEAIGAVMGAATGGVASVFRTGVQAGADVAESGTMTELATLGSRGSADTADVTTIADHSQCEFADNISDVKGCFTAETLVHTETGARPIETIAVGDRVWAFDEKTGQIALQPVKQLFSRLVGDRIDISTDRECIRTTSEHPLWVVGKGWTKAADVSVGSVLLAREGEPCRVHRVEPHPAPASVHNFEVEGWHTYYIGLQQLLVHNACNGGTEGSGSSGGSAGQPAVGPDGDGAAAAPREYNPMRPRGVGIRELGSRNPDAMEFFRDVVDPNMNVNQPPFALMRDYLPRAPQLIIPAPAPAIAPLAVVAPAPAAACVVPWATIAKVGAVAVVGAIIGVVIWWGVTSKE
jgi:RHS repeat-associated protein